MNTRSSNTKPNFEVKDEKATSPRVREIKKEHNELENTDDCFINYNNEKINEEFVSLMPEWLSIINKKYFCNSLEHLEKNTKKIFKIVTNHRATRSITNCYKSCDDFCEEMSEDMIKHRFF